MFLDAAKLAVVEALRAAYAATDVFPVKPRYIGIEYPQQDEMWPALLVQFHPNTVSWAGINPNQYQVLDDDPDFQWENIRVGHFSGQVNLQIFALASAERDRIWDSVVGLVLMSEIRSDTAVFRDTVNLHDQISMTILPSTVSPGGEAASRGVPWDETQIAYDATVSISVLGQFFADIWRQKLVALTAIETFPYTDQDTVPGEADSDGVWVD